MKILNKSLKFRHRCFDKSPKKEKEMKNNRGGAKRKLKMKEKDDAKKDGVSYSTLVEHMKKRCPYKKLYECPLDCEIMDSNTKTPKCEGKNTIPLVKVKISRKKQTIGITLSKSILQNQKKSSKDKPTLFNFNQLEDHLRLKCPNMTVECSTCNQRSMRHKFLKHTQTVCRDHLRKVIEQEQKLN
jgi:hypothetical protein